MFRLVGDGLSATLVGVTLSGYVFGRLSRTSNLSNMASQSSHGEPRPGSAVNANIITEAGSAAAVDHGRISRAVQRAQNLADLLRLAMVAAILLTAFQVCVPESTVASVPADQPFASASRILIAQ